MGVFVPKHKPIGNTEETLENRYEETMARLQKINDAGYTVVSICWCEFRKLSRDTPGLEIELCSHPYVKNSPINIRDAFYGVEPRLLKHYRGEGGEAMRYVDVISLYPYICKYRVSCSPPESVRGCKLSPWLDREGVIKCKVLPLRKL